MRWFNITSTELNDLVRPKKNPNTRTKILLFLTGIVISPVAMIGALFGYARGYNRFMRPSHEMPVFGPMRPIVRFAMISGGVLALVLQVLFAYTAYSFMISAEPENAYKSFILMITVYVVLIINLVICIMIYLTFRSWRAGMSNLALENKKFGTAHFADPIDLVAYTGEKGFYIGGNYTFSDKGHILTVAGTRGGKGTNLIIPNLLGVGGYEGSWVVVDPKAENAAITARYQKTSGNNVVVLNPWSLLGEQIGKPQTYNPLDLVSDKTSIHLIDDLQIVAEMIVPIHKGENDNFFSDNARSIVAGLLLHLVTSEENPQLVKLWHWARLSKAEWGELLMEMVQNDDPVNGEAVVRAAYEILKLEAAGDKTFGSILATVLQCTDFLKSPALQQSLVSGFQPQQLSDGKTTVYIIIPADKLQSHSRWLRLVTMTMLRAVVRNPNKRVAFLLDEFAALGYLPEIENALSTYAGYNITVWPILQSLIQLNAIYHHVWETFIANATIRHFFSINDNFTADYVSQAMGQTSNVVYKSSFFSIQSIESNPRQLITADELRRASGTNIFAFMGEKAPTYFPKRPYFIMGELRAEDGAYVYDDNPYVK